MRSKLKDFIDWNSNSNTAERLKTILNSLPLHMYTQMTWYIQSLDSELESEGAARYYVGMSSICLRRLSKGIKWDSFLTLLLSLLTRGCTDYDIYSVAWALSWTWICPRGRDNRSRSKWRGRVCNYILHEFFADRTYLLRQRGTEHHDLLAVRCASEYFLYVPAHICNSNAAQLIIYKSK